MSKLSNHPIQQLETNTEDLIQRLAALGFQGSYRTEDIIFLLKKAQIKPIDVDQKEYLIQSGQAHYSEMISAESAPTTEHLRHYQQAMHLGATRMAVEIQQLANRLMQRFPQRPIILVSLVRAGVPVGVLLKHCIDPHQSCFHYGISIIRDRGIDHAALNAIIAAHGAESIVFVDGWTGKGAICTELTRSVQHLPALFDQGWDIPRLLTLADLAGFSWLSASCDDWLIPSGILGSVVSGLTSRSILQHDIATELSQNDCFNPEHWHACILYDQLQQHDISVEFIDQILTLTQQHPQQHATVWNQDLRKAQYQACQTTMAWIQQHYQVTDLNRIKPSIAEATRAVLRRVPDRILVKDLQDPNVQLLLHFAQNNQVEVDEVKEHLGPYRAATIIKKVTGKH